MNDIDYMHVALDLAELGKHTVPPNPMVGAVIVREGCIVGKGWHQKAGGPHAEVLAIHEAGALTDGSTLYVTLEPCSHTGKTPPCADLIIKSGIQRVVCAMQDPFYRVNGMGIHRLRKAGIKVDVGILERETQHLNRGYLQVIQYQRPYIIGKWAMTLDGKTATSNGESKWITGEESRYDAHRLRAASDAVTVGIGTVLADNPQLTVRYGRPFRQPLRVVWDTNGRIPLSSKLLTEIPQNTIVLVGEHCPDRTIQNIRFTGATVFPLPVSDSNRLNLQEGLKLLATQCHIQELFVEGGSTLLGELLDYDFLDEIVTYIGPKAFGGENARGAIGGQGVSHLVDARKYSVTDVVRCGTDIKITYHRCRGGTYVHRID